MNPSIGRMLDANANRAREAYRVMEDYARFALSNDILAKQIKSDRHKLADILKSLDATSAYIYRDTVGDVGTTIKATDEFNRHNLSDVMIAATKRLSEALRVMEELAKILLPEIARQVEAMRYRGYSLEQNLLRAIGAQSHQRRLAEIRLCVLLTSSICLNPWEQTLKSIIAGGADCIQLREKNLTDAELLLRARFIVKQCRAAGVLVIINDRPDIAMLAGADGVHLGQNDLPCAEVRKIVGDKFLIGVSTQNLDQVRQAVLDGADYVGVGSMFPSATKVKPWITGPTYAKAAITESPIVCVAIGGVTPENIPTLMQVGVRSVAVCSAVIGDPSPEVICRNIKQQLTRADTSEKSPISTSALTGSTLTNHTG